MVGWKYIKNSLQSYDNSVNKDRPCIRHFSKAAAPHNELKVRMLKMIQEHCQGCQTPRYPETGKNRPFLFFQELLQTSYHIFLFLKHTFVKGYFFVMQPYDGIQRIKDGMIILLVTY